MTSLSSWIDLGIMKKSKTLRTHKIIIIVIIIIIMIIIIIIIIIIMITIITIVSQKLCSLSNFELHPCI